MIDCDEARTRWHLRRDDGGPSAELDAHLASCAECRAYSRQMGKIVDVLAELRVDTERVVSCDGRAEAPDARRSAGPSRWAVHGRWTRIAAAVAMLAAGGFFLSHRSSPTELHKEGLAGGLLQPSPSVVVHLNGESAAKYLAVNRSKPDANVQIVWLYPTMVKTSDDDRG